MPSAADIRQKFFDAHDLAYGFHNPHDDVEMVAIRLTARSSMYQEPPLPEVPATPPAMPAPRETRAVWFTPDAPVAETPVYERSDLNPGMSFAGPAIIEQLDATTPLDPRDNARVAADGSLIITVGGEGA